MFAPMEIVRFLFALVAQKGWSLFHLSIKLAFLNGEILKEVYVEQPKGFEIEGKHHMVYKLKKALYALKQAPRCITKSILIFNIRDFRGAKMSMHSI